MAQGPAPGCQGGAEGQYRRAEAARTETEEGRRGERDGDGDGGPSRLCGPCQPGTRRRAVASASDDVHSIVIGGTVRARSCIHIRSPLPLIQVVQGLAAGVINSALQYPISKCQAHSTESLVCYRVLSGTFVVRGAGSGYILVQLSIVSSSSRRPPTTRNPLNTRSTDGHRTGQTGQTGQAGQTGQTTIWQRGVGPPSTPPRQPTTTPA